MREDESVLTKAIIDLATEYGRYGYRRVTALLRNPADREHSFWLNVNTDSGSS